MTGRFSKVGLVIIYFGFGKGKTTAAVGLAVRAAGAGKKVLFAQFVKAARARQSGEWPLSSELAVLKKHKLITTKVLGKGFVGILGDKKKRREHQLAAKQGLLWLKRQIKSGRYSVVVADELISAIELRLLSVKEVKSIFGFSRKKLAALVLTGHNKYNSLVAAADIVTEMKMIKHAYYKGAVAQRGIDF